MMRLRSVVLLSSVLLVGACGGTSRQTTQSGAGAGGGDGVEEKVVYEKLPDGTIKKTTIRTTRRTVTPQPPAARPADPYPGDPLVKYNVDKINAYRAQKGVVPLVYDAKISAFAMRGSEQLSRDHTPHRHFQQHIQNGLPSEFGTKGAENQGDPNGVPSLDPNPARNGQRQIDVMMQLMMDEGPGGGHYDNMMNPKFRRVGIGIFFAGGKMYLTNDFSD